MIPRSCGHPGAVHTNNVEVTSILPSSNSALQHGNNICIERTVGTLSKALTRPQTEGLKRRCPSASQKTTCSAMIMLWHGSCGASSAPKKMSDSNRSQLISCPRPHSLLYVVQKQRTSLRTTCDTSHLSGSDHLLQWRSTLKAAENHCFPLCLSHSRREWGPRSGLPNVPLSVFLCLEVHERGVARQTCLAGFWRFRQAAAPMDSVARPSRAAWAKKFAEASLSSMSGNLRLLRGQRLATNTCNSCSSMPPAPSASLTPQACSSTSLTRGKSHRGSSQTPRKRLTVSHRCLPPVTIILVS